MIRRDKYFADGKQRYVPILLVMLLLSGIQTVFSQDAPSRVQNPVDETMLTTITLSESAERRLGIDTAVVERKNLPEVLTLGGEIIAAPGNEAIVTAPVSGTITYVTNDLRSLVGSTVKKGQELMQLSVLPPGNELFMAQEDLRVKEIEFNIMSGNYQRSKQLLEDKAISEKAFQAVETEYANAQAALNKARFRVQISNNTVTSGERNGSNIIVISPIDGILRIIMVASGQTVTVSAPLFEVSKSNPVWIRVPVYVGDVQKIDIRQPAVIDLMEEINQGEIISATPVKGSQLSDPFSASSDLFYETTNNKDLLRIGQKVMVLLQKISMGENLVVPFSSLMYDIFGGNWLYVKHSPLTYERRRVQASHIIGDTAVIIKGITAGEEVVTAGVAELYGTEFGGEK